MRNETHRRIIGSSYQPTGKGQYRIVIRPSRSRSPAILSTYTFQTSHRLFRQQVRIGIGVAGRFIHTVEDNHQLFFGGIFQNILHQIHRKEVFGMEEVYLQPFHPNFRAFLHEIGAFLRIHQTNV